MVGDLSDDPQSPTAIVGPRRKIRRKSRTEPVTAVGHFEHDTSVVPRLDLDGRTPMLAGICKQFIERKRQVTRTVTKAVGNRHVMHRAPNGWNVIRIATQDGGEVAIPSLC